MFLKFEVTKDNLLLMVQTGPKEQYDPEEHKEIVDLFTKVQKLDKEIKEMRAEIDPKLIEITKTVKKFNQKQTNKLELKE